MKLDSLTFLQRLFLILYCYKDRYIYIIDSEKGRLL